MKDRERFKNALIALGAIHKEGISELQATVYWEALKDYEDDIVHDALAKGTKYHWRFFPKPPEIVQLIEGNTDDKVLMAWEMLGRAIENVGHSSSIKFSDPVIHSIIDLWGGWIKVCNMDARDFKFMRKDFNSLYRIYSQRDGHPAYLIGEHEMNNRQGGSLKFIDVPHEVHLIDGRITIIWPKYESLPEGEKAKQLDQGEAAAGDGQ